MTQDRLQEAKDLLAATEGHTEGPWRGVMDGHMHAVRADSLFGDYSVCIDPEWKKVLLIAAAPTLRDLLAWAVGEVERLRDEMRLARALSEAVDAYEEEDDEATCFALYDAIPKANAAFMRAHYSGTGKPGTRVNRLRTLVRAGESLHDAITDALSSPYSRSLCIEGGGHSPDVNSTCDLCRALGEYEAVWRG